MDDLKDYNFRIALVRGFVQDPSNFLLSAKKYLNGSEFQKIRIRSIYELLTMLISDSMNYNELVEKLSNTSDSATQSQLNNLKVTFINNEELFDTLKNTLKELAQEIIDTGIDLPIVRENILDPIHPSDHIFLSKLSRSSLTEETDGFTLEDMSTPGFKSKVAEMYHEMPYYFEQAFSNTEIKIQSMLLDYIRDRHSKTDENQVREFNNLADLYALSDIDNLILKIKNVNSVHQAFQKILTLLNENEKTKLINKILKENVIMRSLFQIDPKNPFHGLSKMFVNSKYPYDGIILSKYKSLMFKKDSEMEDIIEILKKDENFNNAYANYLNVKKTLDKKRKIENTMSTINDRTKSEKKNDIINTYEIMMADDLNQDILSFDDLLNYSRKINQTIIKSNLHMDKEVNSEVNKYFIHKLNTYLTNKKVKSTQKSVVYGIDPIDVWYDTNRIFEENNVTDYTKIYLKYSEKYAYEFVPKNALTMSNRELPLQEIRALPEDVDCIICTEGDEKRFNLFDLYINRLYQRIFKIAFKGKIEFKDKKNMNKNKAFTSSEETTFKKFINDYAALVFIIQKDEIFFKEFYKSRAKELLKEMITFEKSYSDICDNVTLTTTYDYNEIFSDRELLKRLYTELDKGTGSIESNMKEFIALAPVNANDLDKSESFSK